MSLKSKFIILLCSFSCILANAADDVIAAQGSLICRVVPGQNVTNFGKQYNGKLIKNFNETVDDMLLGFKTVFITVPLCDPALGGKSDKCKKESKRYTIISNDSDKRYLSIRAYDSIVASPVLKNPFPTIHVWWKESNISYKETQFVTLGKYQFWGSERGTKSFVDPKLGFIQGIFYEFTGDLNHLGFSETWPKPSINLRGVLKYNDRYWALIHTIANLIFMKVNEPFNPKVKSKPTPSNINFILASETYLDGIVKLLHERNPKVLVDKIKTKTLKEIKQYKDDPLYWLYIATIENEVVGLCRFHHSSCVPAHKNRFPAPAGWYGMGILVLAKWRRHNISSFLTQKRIEKLKKMKIDSLYSVVDSDNLSSKKMHEKYGFKKVAQARGFLHIDFEDKIALLYKLRIDL